MKRNFNVWNKRLNSNIFVRFYTLIKLIQLLVVRSIRSKTFVYWIQMYRMGVLHVSSDCHFWYFWFIFSIEINCIIWNQTFWFQTRNTCKSRELHVSSGCLFNKFPSKEILICGIIVLIQIALKSSIHSKNVFNYLHVWMEWVSFLILLICFFQLKYILLSEPKPFNSNIFELKKSYVSIKIINLK